MLHVAIAISNAACMGINYTTQSHTISYIASYCRELVYSDILYSICAVATDYNLTLLDHFFLLTNGLH